MSKRLAFLNQDEAVSLESPKALQNQRLNLCHSDYPVQVCFFRCIVRRNSRRMMLLAGCRNPEAYINRRQPLLDKVIVSWKCVVLPWRSGPRSES